MADQKLTALTELTSVASDDSLYIVDKSDITDGADGSSKRITRANLVSGITTGLAASGANSDITSLSGLTTTITVAQGGTGSATASDARTALGLAIGSNVQAYDADLDTWAGKTAPSGTVIGTTDTQTLTNKTVKPRVLSATSYTTDTGTSLNCDNYDMFIVTAQAGALKFNNPSGTPYDGQKLWLAVTGTAARALTYDTQYESSNLATLPTTTVTTLRTDIGLVYRADTSKWHCVAVA